MSPAMEADDNLSIGHFDICWGVNEIPENVSCLGVTVSSHAACQTSIEATGYDQQGHVKVDLQAHRRGQCIHMKESHGIGQGVLDQHALGVSSNQALGTLGIVGENNGRLFVS